MNRIYKLFDEKYALALLKKRVLPLYPNFKSVRRVEIIPHKKLIWETTYHVVVELRTYFVTDKNRVYRMPIFCSAHSSEPREQAYQVLSYLWQHSFNQGDLTIPRPLFFDEYLNGFFYRGAEGENLRFYMMNKDHEEISRIVPLSAQWFNKLHSLKNIGSFNFNILNSRIATAVPGREEILDSIKIHYPHYAGFYQQAYDFFVSQEEAFFKSTNQRWLIHGDAHPENIIHVGHQKLALIDFTDLSLADFARDLGCFLKQFEYMSSKARLDKDFVEQMKKSFLDNYFKNSSEILDDALRVRINNYFNWTELRTITYLLMSGAVHRDAQRLSRIDDMVIRLKNDLNF